MPSFREIADSWMQQNSTEMLDCNLIFSNIGDIEIEKLSSKEKQDCLIDLYDNKKLRGAVYASYEKFLANVCKYACECGYISEITTIEHRSEPAPNLYYMPDSAALERLVSHEDCTPTGTIIRLAWCCGLMRNEIAGLLWEQADLQKKQLVLPNRKIQLTDEMVSYLSRLKKENALCSEYVLVSQRKTAPLAEQSISALARKALDNYGQKNVRLNDLRSDFIVRMLRENSWEYVSYISGVDLPALRQHYLPHTGDDKTVCEITKTQITQSVRESLQDIIKTEETGMCGLSLKFVWEMGIPVSVLPLMTWDILDFDKSIITFADRTINIPEDFLSVLRRVKNSQDGEYDNIILNENKRKPTDAIFLQRAVRQLLVRRGVSGITASDLQNDYWQQHYSEIKALKASGVLDLPAVKDSKVYSVPKSFPAEIVEPLEDKLLDYLKKNGSADHNTLKSALNFSDKEILLLLKNCRMKGKIVRVGVRYFLPETIVKREKQKEVILEYVKNKQPVTSAELTKILGLVDRRQIFAVINPMLQAGELIRASKNNYCMPDYVANSETA